VSFSASAEGSRPTVVRLAGELDIATAAELRNRLASIEGDIELDCSRLEFVDAAGLGVFVSAHKRLDGEGWKLVLVEPTPLLLRLLSVTGLDASLHVRSEAGSPR
jgi:anti-sigma B factor antagonist